MKDLYIIPECYIDTNMVETLIRTEGCNHQKGCGTVGKVMNERFANGFAVGIIDKDKRGVNYFNEFDNVVSFHSLQLKKHRTRPHFLIVIAPAMDGFILKCAEELGMKMEDYGFPSGLKEFTSVTKSVTSKNDASFKVLFKEFQHRSASKICVLQRWLEYLREHKWKSNTKELLDIVGEFQ